MSKILVVDDELSMREFLSIFLEKQGYKVATAADGEKALKMAQEERFDLAISDIRMPGLSGLELLAQLKPIQPDLAFILITAFASPGDAVMAMKNGAFDYITKPFNPVELLARVRSQLRRYLQLGGGQVQASTLIIGGICLDDNAKTVTVDGDPVALTPKEYDILRFLMRNAGTMFSPNEIYRRVWEDVPLNAAGAIAVHIRHLREKIEENPSKPVSLVTAKGLGYRLNLKEVSP